MPGGHVLRAEGRVEGTERRLWGVGDGADRGHGDAGRTGAAEADAEGDGPSHPPLSRTLPQPTGRTVRQAEGDASDALQSQVRQGTR